MLDTAQGNVYLFCREYLWSGITVSDYLQILNYCIFHTLPGMLYLILLCGHMWPRTCTSMPLDKRWITKGLMYINKFTYTIMVPHHILGIILLCIYIPIVHQGINFQNLLLVAKPTIYKMLKVFLYHVKKFEGMNRVQTYRTNRPHLRGSTRLPV